MESVRSLDHLLPADLDKRLVHPSANLAGDVGRDTLDGLQPAIKLLQEICRDDELLQNWWMLGTAVSADGHFFDPESLTRIKTATSRLAALTRYQWLERMSSLLDLPQGSEALKRCDDSYIDREHGAISLKGLDTYIRGKLREQVPPKAFLEVNEDSIILFGKVLLRDTFRPASWKVLLCLANQAGEPVERRDLYAAVSGQDAASYCDVAPHVTDLRKTLEPAFADCADPNQLPVQSTGDLIKGERRKGGSGPYVLTLPAGQVEINIP